MGTIVSKIYDEIKLHGSYEAWRAWEDSQRSGTVKKPAPEPTPREEYKLGSVHYLKTWPGPFNAVMEGYKTAEMRFDDRKFRVGDVLVLQEWKPGTMEFTGREVVRLVSYILEGGTWGIEPGYVMLSMSLFPSNP